MTNSTFSSLLGSLGLQGSLNDYATISTQLFEKLSALTQHSELTIQQAIAEFNQAFMQTEIPPLTDLSGELPAIDANVIETIGMTFTAQPSIQKRNMLSLVRQCYHSMGKHYQNLALTYHNPRHGAEMYLELLQLLTNTQTDHPLQPYQRLLPLCGLYHDVIFTGTRGQDETQSAQELINHLQPILTRLSDSTKEIIEHIIYSLIVGGTLPCFLKKDDKLGIANLGELLVVHSLPSPLPANLAMAMGVISCADITRSRIQPLYERQIPYDNDDWKQLESFYQSDNQYTIAAVQRMMTQALRVWAEVNKSTSFAQLIRQCQTHTAQSRLPEQAWDNAEIATLNDQLFSKTSMIVSFEERLQNRFQEIPLPFTVIDLSDAMRQIWEKIHQYLADSRVGIEQKNRVLNALAHVAIEQDGKTLMQAHLQDLTRHTPTSGGLITSAMMSASDDTSTPQAPSCASI